MMNIFRKLLFSVVLLCFIGISTINGKGKKDTFQKGKGVWKNFVCYNFEFEGRDARIVLPDTPLRGNPWVWRARFPEWHTEMDSILLAEGFFVAYINTNNMYGSPSAMRVWDNFYEFLTTDFNLNKKLSLEGVSRGGLFIYNWAKKNSEKIDAIYAEAPVCDFNSWPRGNGKGMGSNNDWSKLKKEYKFISDEEAANYTDNPIDNLEKLAKAKIPILHMIGLNDSVVPPTENTFALIERYVNLGGPAIVIPCTKGKQNLFGHHFPIETPCIGADFIKYYTDLPNELIEASKYHNHRRGIKNSMIKFTKEKKGRVAFLGGSITYNGGWRDSICNYLQTTFPETNFEFIKAGIPSMGSTPAAFRLQRDVLVNGPVDLLFLEAAVNDAANGRTSGEQIRAMEGIIRHVKYVNSAADIVVMHFVDPEKMDIYRSGDIPQVIKNHEKVAEHYGIPSINLAKEVTERIDAGEFSWKKDFKNLHPSPFGQGVYYRSMEIFLKNEWNGYVDNDDKMVICEMPNPLDESNYDRGTLIDVKNIKTNKNWEIVEKWNPKDGKGTRDNYVDVDMLAGKKVGKTLVFKFKGDAVGIAVAAGPDAGIINFKIDNEDWKEQDLFTKWSGHLYLPWYYTLASELNNGNHTLKIRIADENNVNSIGTSCYIRYLFVNE